MRRKRRKNLYLPLPIIHHRNVSLQFVSFPSFQCSPRSYTRLSVQSALPFSLSLSLSLCLSVSAFLSHKHGRTLRSSFLSKIVLTRLLAVNVNISPSFTAFLDNERSTFSGLYL